MSHAVKRADASRAAAGSGEPPASATVLDFICLYSHDLRRKQKRWQDGKLKYHTFNKRVMVYDDRGGFIGDAHWQEDHELGEGEELTLDRGSAVVQVCDCTGSREQDLSEILDKRAREVEQRRATAAAVRTPARRQEDPRPHSHLRNVPLNAIVPNPGATIGRAAVPNRSPYEARITNQDGSAAKRRKLSVSPPSKAGYASSLFGTRLSLSGGMLPARSRALRDTTNVPARSVEGEEKGEEDADEAVGKLPRSEEVEDDEEAELLRRLEAIRSRSKAAKLNTAKEEEPVRRPETSSRSKAAKSTKPAEDEPIREFKVVRSRPKPMKPPKDAAEDEAVEEPEVIRSRPKPAKPSKPPRAVLPSVNKATESTADDVVEVISESSAEGERPPKKKNLASRLVSSKPKDTSKEPKRKVTNEEPKPAIIDDKIEEARPRTELRIKSRRKRGLLMVSEKKQSVADEPAPEPFNKEEPVPEVVPKDLPVLVPSSLPEPHQQDRPPESDGCPEDELPEDELPEDELPEDDELEKDKSLEHDEPLKYDKTPEPDDTSEQEEPMDHEKAVEHDEPLEPDEPSEHESFDEGPSNPSKTLIEESDEDEEAAPIVRRSRQRRKEVVESRTTSSSCSDTERRVSPRQSKDQTSHDQDFPFSSDSSEDEPTDFHPKKKQAPKTRQKRQAAADTGPRVVRIRKGIKCKEILGFVPPDDHLVPAPLVMENSRRMKEPSPNLALASMAAPRIANPATRGRKAARKEDAAGTVPQVMVPLEPVGAKRVIGAPPVTLEKKSLPGFSSANGGAWSRHAEDLLGMTRPEGRR